MELSEDDQGEIGYFMKKRVLLINEVFGTTSTGKICAKLAEEFEADGDEVRVAFGRWNRVPEQYGRFAYYIGSDRDVLLHVMQTRLFDAHGFGSGRATERFLQWAEEYQPDLVWLHNLHGYYINVEMLFGWLKRHPQIEVKWTLHDCWAFTGHCTHFTVAGCEQWKTHCEHCMQLRRYPACYGHSSVRENFERKRRAFCGVENMTLYAPSQWLANLIRQSFLKEYPVEVHYNTIDTSVFKPTASDLRERYGLQNKVVVLGVSNVWNERKGLGDFCRLAEMLDQRYAIVLVGISKKQIRSLPQNIIPILHTSSAQELAGIYTTADVLLSLSREETFGMTPVEAQACGTPSIVYADTACAEIAQMTGNIVVQQDINEVYKAIIQKWS